MPAPAALKGRLPLVAFRNRHSATLSDPNELSDVVMSKDKQGAYAAKIVELRAVPGAPRLESCTLCTGKNKDKPLMGFVPLSHLKATPSNQIEFYEGDYLDPRTGKQYKTRARLSNSGKHLTLYNVDLATHARHKMTWVKY